MNKTIHRNQSTTKIFDDRSVGKDYATLLPVLRDGLLVLDVGCGTGAISKGIAERVAPSGRVMGIDNNAHFIDSGKNTYKDVVNLELIQADLYSYEPPVKFDLIVAARVVQWLSNPKDALAKMRSWLKPNGMLSILDYNHEALEWKPEPPESMKMFYQAFLKWRADAGMDNRIADNLETYFKELNFSDVVVLNAAEVYKRGDEDFIKRAGIWAKVAELKQISDEGYIDDSHRQTAIQEYMNWVNNDAQRMVMKLKETRGTAY